MPLVLVVDDDADYRKLVSHMLTAARYDVEVAESGFGLSRRLLQAPTPDLVLLDCMMPGLTGPALVEILARLPKAVHIPVLLMSAARLDTFAEAAGKHPNCRFVEKPASLRALVALVDDVVRGPSSNSPSSSTSSSTSSSLVTGQP